MMDKKQARSGNMTNIWMLTKANLRKSKTQTLTMLLLIALSAMLLNFGLVMQFRLTDFFNERAEELNSAHWASIRGPEEYGMARYEFIRDLPETAEAEYCVNLFSFGSITVGGVLRTAVMIIVPYDESSAQRMNPPRLIGDSLELTGDAIYVPYFMLRGAGAALGGEVLVNFEGEELSFTLAGGTEEILFGAQMSNLWRVYIPSARFEELRGRFPDNVNISVFARVHDGAGFYALSNAYAAETAGSDFWLVSRGTAREARTMIPLIAAVLIAVFAVIMLAVGVIVIRFQIINGIEENMQNIGILKAMGFRTRQIKLSLVMQYGGIAGGGGVVGILAAQLAFPLVTGIIQPYLALVWRPAFDWPIMLISLAFVTAAVVIFSYVSTLRLGKLHPLVALRGGIATHSFRRNPFALDKARGPLTLLLSLKSLLKQKKQAVMVCIIILSVTFTAVSGIAIHYNVNVDNSAFVRLVSNEFGDVGFTLADTAYADEFRARMAERSEVERLFSGGMVTTIHLENISFAVYVICDFANIAGWDLLEGRLPRHDNEILIGATMLDFMGKSIGDWVTLYSFGGETSTEFLVTGSTQSMSHNGMISHAALARIGFEAEIDWFNVILSRGTDAEAFVASVMAENSDILLDGITVDDIIDGVFGPIGDIFGTVTAAVLIVVAAVIILVLYLVMKTTIIRRRRELGLQKALGFTTLQLMNQIALSLAPAVILGALAGAAGGYLGFNPIFVALLRGAGIARADLPVPAGMTVIMCIALIVLAYVVSMLIAWRVRKISACELVR